MRSVFPKPPTQTSTPYIGCAGWALRKEHGELVPASGTHLQRYAEIFNGVEINSSFYRPHRLGTYQRWAASTPADFRFAVKFPKQVTHLQRLANAESQIERFAAEVSGLGEKLGPILVQLPPSLPFDDLRVAGFARSLRKHFAGPIVCEPRHASWFSTTSEALLTEHHIGRVAADPSVAPAAALPGGDLRCVYFRWHGAPRVYYSSYDADALQLLRRHISDAAQTAEQVWCIFDNTAEGAALLNARELAKLLNRQRRSPLDYRPPIENENDGATTGGGATITGAGTTTGGA